MNTIWINDGANNNELLDIYNALACEALLISKIPEKNVKYSLLSKVIKEYLNNDPIIPYDMSERKMKYPKAFKECEKFDL